MAHPVGKAAAAVVGVVLAWRMASEVEAERRAPEDDSEPPSTSPIVVTQTDGTRITVAPSAVRAADGSEDDDTTSRSKRPKRGRSGRGGVTDSGDAVEAIAARAAIGAGLAPPRKIAGRDLAESVPVDAAAPSVRDLLLEPDVEHQPVSDTPKVSRLARVRALARSLVLVMTGLAGLALTAYAVTSPYGASAFAAILGGLVLVAVAWRISIRAARPG